jgi:hypothetical protein
VAEQEKVKIHSVEQGSLDWFRLHIGIPTASGLDQLLTPEFEFRTGDMPKTYMHRKLAEAWRGKPMPSLGAGGSFNVEQGSILEEEALPWYELEFDAKVIRVGFITTDDNKFGASPDGLIATGSQEILYPFGATYENCTSFSLNHTVESGLEIKAPAAHTHVKYLVEGVLPKEYRAQCHGGMYATGLNRWRFVSYRRGFPSLVVDVDRDEEIQKKIGEAIARFHANFDLGRSKLAEYNQE